VARSRFYYKTEDLGSYTGRIADATDVAAPRDTGTLYRSIETEHSSRWESVGAPPAIAGVRVLTGSVSTNLWYAVYVEHNTGKYGPGGRPYVILPKRPNGRLVFYIDGRKIVARKVMHPGSVGKHMFAKGTAFVAKPGYIKNQTRDIMSRWRSVGAVVLPPTIGR
jgi:hypothetical protein